jgi:hypothetical protein
LWAATICSYAVAYPIVAYVARSDEPSWNTPKYWPFTAWIEKPDSQRATEIASEQAVPKTEQIIDGTLPTDLGATRRCAALYAASLRLFHRRSTHLR